MPLRGNVLKILLGKHIFKLGLGGLGCLGVGQLWGLWFPIITRLWTSSYTVFSNGWCMLIYPEGTRTPDGNLLPFKKGPFMVAVQTGLPILPVTTNGAFRILPKKKIAFRPGRMSVTIAKPIITEGLTENDVPMLMEQTRKAIESNLDTDYDPFKDR